MEKSNSKGEFPTTVTCDLLDADKLTELIHMLNLDQVEFDTAKVYDTRSHENVVVPDVRSAKRAQFKSDTVFDWVQKNIVDELNNLGTNFILVRNDIDVIKYGPGDFFKRHRDHVNIESNEFINYTFLLCVKACEEGGDTVLYESDSLTEHPIFYGCTARSPGSILVFPKTTPHEGLPVVRGRKVVLMGNLMGFRSKDTNDKVIITLDKAPGTTFTFDAETLKLFPGSMYYAFYDLNKRSYPNKRVYVMRDQHSTPAELYEIMAMVRSQDEMKFIQQRMDFLGIKDMRGASRLSKFLHGSDKILMCHLGEYFDYLVRMPDNFLPFQLITVDGVVVWFGVADNLFVTADYQIGGAYKHYDRWEDCNCGFVGTDNDNEPEGEDDDDGDEDAESEEGSEDQHESHDLSHIKNALKGKLQYSVDQVINREDAGDEDPWMYTIDDRCDEGQTLIREYLWKELGLNSLRAISNYKGTYIDQIHAILKEIINILSQGSGSVTTHKLPGDYDVNITRVYKGSEKLRGMIESVGIEKLISMISSNEVISKYDQTGESYYCNESHYASYDVICRFGFMRM